MINGVVAIPAGGGKRQIATFGNARPGSIIGPSLTQIDATVGRTFSIKELVKLDVKLDGFNVLNHVNYNQPSASFSGTYGGGFGVISSANAMRELQLSVHIIY